MEIGSMAAEVLELLPVPFLVLEGVASGPRLGGDLRVAWANPQARDRFGPEIEGAWLDRDQPFGSTAPIVPEAEASRLGGRLSVVERTVERQGSVAHLRCTVLPIAAGAAMIVEDTTAEAEARAELAVVGSTLERVERWGNLGVWEIDLKASTVYWSTQVYEILGVDEQCLSSFLGAVHPDDRAIVDHVTQRLLEQPGPYRVTHRIVRGGEVRTVEQHMQSVPDETGRPVRLLGTMIDVTATRALQQQLHHGQQMRTVGLLAGGMAHDLANAVLVIRGHADVLLARSDLDADVRDSLAAIARGGERASALARRFMSLGRQSELRPIRVDPDDVLQEVVDLVGPVVRADVDVSIERAAADAPLLVLADPDRLRQVLLDLVLNARDAGASSIVLRSGEVVLHPGDRRCTEGGVAPGRYGVLEVADDGGGIEAHLLDRIFDPFFTTKGSEEGSGLGLANAHDFVRQSLGTIDVASEPGVGTTMSVLLPATVAADAVPVGHGRRRARRVLVGARPDRGEELLGILAGAGAQVVHMSDLDGLTFSLETEPIDVAVVDDTLVTPSSWPVVLGRVPTVVVTSEPGTYPQAVREVRRGDAGGLLGAIDELLAAPAV